MRRLVTDVAGALVVVVALAVLVKAQDFQDGMVLDAGSLNKLSYRVKELERKVAGVQEQVNVLHAKCAALENGAAMLEARVRSNER